MARYAVTICSVVTMVSRYEPGMWCCRGLGQTMCDSSLTVYGLAVAPEVQPRQITRGIVIPPCSDHKGHR